MILVLIGYYCTSSSGYFPHSDIVSGLNKSIEELLKIIIKKGIEELAFYLYFF